MQPAPAAFERRTVDELRIRDEPSFRHVALYADLKEVLRRAAYRFRVLPEARAGQIDRADRALFLNLTFWSPEAGGDVLVDDRIEADVIAHAAWHHLTARALERDAGEAREVGGAGAPPSVESLFLGESIASAFDVYLVGRLIGHSPRSTFLKTQVPAMAEAAEGAGLGEDDFQAMLERAAADPDRAFADLRELLYDAATSLFACADCEQAQAVLADLDRRPFAPLLHRYELSNWILYARAYARHAGPDERARAVDRALREAPVSLDWLTATWVLPAIEPGVRPADAR